MGSVSCRRVEKRCSLKTVHVIGIPIGEGQDWESGVEEAPSALRVAGLVGAIEELGMKVNDVGDILVAKDAGYVLPSASDGLYGPDDVKNLIVIGHSLRRLFETMKRVSSTDNSFILNIGGDHSIGSASILGRLRAHTDLGVIWVDAHGDCNTPESSESKNYHGMPAAHAMGWFTRTTPGFEWMDEALKNPLPENRLVYIGLRDLDPRERELHRKSKVKIFTMKDVDRLGIAGVMTEALRHLSTGPLHLSFDIDAIDPSVAPGTGTLARGGLSYRESHYICESLADSGRLVSMDMVEVNPKLDTPVNTQKHLHGDDPKIHTDSPTVRLAIELVTSALGKIIL